MSHCCQAVTGFLSLTAEERTNGASLRNRLLTSTIPIYFHRVRRGYLDLRLITAKKTAWRSSVGQQNLPKIVCVIFLFCAAVATESPAQTFSTLLSFDGSNGAAPGYGSLIQGPDGNFYGTTIGGGAHSA